MKRLGVVVVVKLKRRKVGGEEEARKESSLGSFVAREAWLSDWLAGQCGVLSFAWRLVNQGFWERRMTSSPS